MDNWVDCTNTFLTFHMYLWLSFHLRSILEKKKKNIMQDEQELRAVSDTWSAATVTHNVLDKDGHGLTLVNLDLGPQPNNGGDTSTPGLLQQHY